MKNELQILSRDKSENWSVTFGLFTADTDKGSWEKVLNETAIMCPTIEKVIREKNFELRRARLKYRLNFKKIHELSHHYTRDACPTPQK